MTELIHILHLEDEPSDTELVGHALKKANLTTCLRRVASRDDFIAGLDGGDLDLILADYNLPTFDGLSALAAAHERRPDVPFLFLSGFLGEEVAIESLRQGATDYVFKHNLKRLGPAVLRALRESRRRRAQINAEAALQASEAALRSFFDAAPFMMGVVELIDDDIRHLSVNATSAHFHGTTPEAMKGRYCSEHGVPREIINTWLIYFRQAEQSNRPVRFEYRHPRGDRVHQLSVTVSPLPVVPGQSRRYCYVAEDATDRKLLEQQFLRAQRLESIGTLASGIAHDLNNVLAPFRVSLKVFRPRLTAAEDRELLDALDASARRGAEIIRQLLTFARGAERAVLPVQLKHLLHDLEIMIRETFPRSIEIGTDVPEDLWVVHGDTTQVYQALLNLCLNARDAMPQGGQLVVLAANAVIDEVFAASHPDSAPGNYVALTVADTGTGIPEGVRSRIFDPFFTTKEIGKGTGLGLSTALAIVRGHGGFIHVISQPGQGSRFVVHLPAESGNVTFTPPEVPASIPRGAGERLLVVDDEAAIRQAVKAMLLDQGYEVITTCGGREALAALDEHADQIRLVITDLVMPGMDGVAFVRELRRMRPHLPIIVVSGVLESRPLPAGDEWRGVLFLRKPVVPDALLERVHSMLQARETGQSPPTEIACVEPPKLGMPVP